MPRPAAVARRSPPHAPHRPRPVRRRPGRCRPAAPRRGLFKADPGGFRAASVGTGAPGQAEVSPVGVTPGGTVTVSVSCASTGGSAPATLDATSPAFDEGNPSRCASVEGD
ncbi:hypothetical protein LV779_15125 [Streptomyces thinghirensis]|nr:hypothetical protein [Streptomyces thinghirensis]